MEICTPKEYTFSVEFITIYFKHDRGKSKNVYEKFTYGQCFNITE